ncbi:MAG: hypothetical protein PHD95_03120 [Candidatus ainarchaeum sp.]|nr:hypothetical protein [Candidatus ainarchaeum sp.]
MVKAPRSSKPVRPRRRVSDKFERALRETRGLKIRTSELANVMPGLQAVAFDPESVRKEIRRQFPSLAEPVVQRIIAVTKNPHFSPRERNAAMIGAFHSALYAVKTPRETEHVLKQIIDLAQTALRQQRESLYVIRRKD